MENTDGIIYMDNAATTCMLPELREDLKHWLDYFIGNPSSQYNFGFLGDELLRNARRYMSLRLNCEPEEIIFTSGGTESDNTAILSVALEGKKSGKTHIVTSAFEHPAVLKSLARLEMFGFDVKYVKPSSEGIVNPDDIAKAIRSDTCLVTVMMANNEVGTIQPIQEIGAICHDHNVLFHTDAVQAVGHIPIDLEKLNVDMLSASAHKFHGMTGTGFLYARHDIPLHPLLVGGHQEKDRRAGTENVMGIVAMNDALAIVSDGDEENIRELRLYLTDRIKESISNVIINSSPDGLPGIASVTFEGVNATNLVSLLNEYSICVSAGSACSSKDAKPSHVLLSMGRTDKQANETIRFSLSRMNTKQEVDAVMGVLLRCVSILREARS